MENAPQTGTNKNLEFYGQGFEFFKIWIVNLLLTLLTAGFYSPWAKVRTRRYLYGNTFLDNSAFDFVADPVKILKGRIIAVIVFILFSYSSFLPENLQAVTALLIIGVIPWIIIKSLKFNFYNTTYRNIRFNFHGSYFNALYVYILLPLFIVFTLGLAYPYFIKSQKQFIIQNSRYGTTGFLMNATVKAFYRPFIMPMAILLALANLSAITHFNAPVFDISSLQIDHVIKMTQIIGFMIALLLVYIYAYFYTHISNLIINHSKLAEYQFSSSLHTGHIFWLFISNLIAIIVSFGLLIPWAKIRFLHYRISCVSVTIHDDLNAFISAENERTTAIAEEIGDLFDIDIGL